MKQAQNERKPWIFFLIAFGFSWLFWIPATFIDEDILNSSWSILLYLGGLGPAIAGLALTYLNKDKNFQKDYWRRLLNPNRIGRKWYWVILLMYPLLVVLIAIIVTGQIQASETLKDLMVHPVQLILFVLFIFIFGPFPEELGWRGYALDELQKSMNAVTASLVLGTLWAVWHVPLFFMNGTYQNEMGFGSGSFWQFCIFAVVFSIFITWVYNNNQRSTLSAAIFHFSINLTGNLFKISATEELIRNILLVLIALIIIKVYGTSTLRLAGNQNNNQIA